MEDKKIVSHFHEDGLTQVEIQKCDNKIWSNVCVVLRTTIQNAIGFSSCFLKKKKMHLLIGEAC